MLLTTATRALPACHASFRPIACRAVAKRCVSAAATQEDEAKPAASTDAKEELPPWIRREQEQKLQAADPDAGAPFGVLLLLSSMVAIAAVGSIFEYTNQNAIFGVLGPDSPLYAPILGFFALTGLPTAGWLFLQSVNSANREADRMDRVDDQ